MQVLKGSGVYQEVASRLYQLAAKATEWPDDWKPAAHLSILSIYLSLQDNILGNNGLKQALADQTQIAKRCQETDILVKTRCGGLLEVQYRGTNRENISPDAKIFYHHRTVKDFLEARETRPVLLKHTNGPEMERFKPNYMVASSYIFQLQTCDQDSAQSLANIVGQSLTYVRRVDADKRIPIAELIQLVDAIPSFAIVGSRLAVVTSCNLKRYVSTKLADHNFIEGAIAEPTSLLKHVLQPSEDAKAFIRPEMILLLLQYGANPNEPSNDGGSAWRSGLSYLISHHEELHSATLRHWSEVVEILLEHGADPKVVCEGQISW